jgi:hypothetical protein
MATTLEINGRTGSGLGTLALGALGVVYGDIGTSPLYTIKTAVDWAGGAIAPEEALGMLSLIVALMGWNHVRSRLMCNRHSLQIPCTKSRWRNSYEPLAVQPPSRRNRLTMANALSCGKPASAAFCGAAVMCLLKTPKGREGVEIFAPPPYRRGHDHNSFHLSG